MLNIKKLLCKLTSEALNVGEVRMYAGTTAPNGWIICDGSAVSRTTYAKLFAIIGTTYGAGDGNTTFNLPNMGGKMPLGVSGTKYPIGDYKGSADAVVVSHSHIAKDGKVGNNPSAFNTNSSGTCTTSGTSKTLTGEFKIRGFGTSAGSTSVTGASGVFTRGTTSGAVRGSANSGSDAGATPVTLDATHTHTIPNHTHSIPADSHTHNFTQPSIASTGIEGTDQNMPPYCVINFIIYAGV